MPEIQITDPDKLVELTLAGVQTVYHSSDGESSWPDKNFCWWWETSKAHPCKEEELRAGFAYDLKYGGYFTLELE